MSDESADHLPFLVCPLIVSPARDFESEAPLHLLPFPGINLNLEGFTVPHLPWVGINVAKPWQRKPLIKLAAFHEAAHENSLSTPFARAKKQETGRLYWLLLTTFLEGRERIEVPLRSDLPRNELEKQWRIITLISEESRLIEEIYAVRTSLLKAQESRYIKPEAGEEILSYYKGVYDKLIDDFQLAYEAIDFIAMKVGETAANAMISFVLHTGNPTTAFWDIIWAMCTLKSRIPTNEFMWKFSPKQTTSLANLSFQKAVIYFLDLLKLDSNDSRYRIITLQNYLARKERWRAFQYEKIDFYKFFLHTPPNTYLYSQYHSNLGILTLEYGRFKKVKYAPTYIFLEAILQQLLTGKGLACPFWYFSSGICCNDSSRELLEKVWECTSPDRSCDWKRRGCLNQ